MGFVVAKILWDIGFRRILAGSLAKSLLTKCVKQLGIFLARPVEKSIS